MVSDLAYLVIREGSKWSDVFRLVPGESVTIGRAPTNQIVLKDERCSRNHAELFLSEGRWTLRDLDSRNGTVVQEQLLKGDRPLRPGDVVRIGRSQLVFVYNLSEAFSEAGTVVRRPAVAAGDKTVDSRSKDASSTSAPLIGASGYFGNMIAASGQTRAHAGHSFLQFAGLRTWTCPASSTA